MNKRLGAYIIVSALLNGSVAMFGMHNQPQHSAASHGLDLADLEKKLETDFEKANNVLHPLVQKGVEELKKEPQTVVAALTKIGIKQQDAQNITDVVEKVADVVGKGDDAAYNLAQKLEASKNADQNAVAAAKK